MSKRLEKTYRGLIKSALTVLTGKANKYKKQGLQLIDNHLSNTHRRRSPNNYKGASLICSSNLPIFNSENKNSNI